ncbi:MAG: ATP-dependent DNA helicase RecG [Clostridia bacterium]|nr:ATP-dependent DNA helicase RecG [Clostridia bacterium]
MNGLTTPVTALPGVGAKTAAKLNGLGIYCLGDFLTFFPRGYEDRSKTVDIFESTLAEGKVCVRALVRSTPTSTRISGGKTMVKVPVCDSTGAMEMVFFNQPYVKTALEAGREYIFFGKAEAFGSRKSMTNPLFEPVDAGVKTGRLTPIYPGTAGLKPRIVHSCVELALLSADWSRQDPLPENLRTKYKLCSQADAYSWIHKPNTWEDVRQARRRLVFEELFLFCLTTGYMSNLSRKKGIRLREYDINDFYAALPFTPTNGQKDASAQMIADMCSGSKMNRLLQGDVGSGKTLVAAACAYQAVRNGGQAVIMAPTEILASQHYETFSRFFEPFGVRCALLTSSMTAAQKKLAREHIKNGDAQIVCGTHALIQDSVEYRNPYLFVVDEQHRFGVRQRAALQQKAGDAHFLVMSATPIPRTLTLILYGDLSVSVLSEKPAGRKPVQTFVVPEYKRDGMYNMVWERAQAGEQTYIICPLIEQSEDSEDTERKAAADYAAALQKKLPRARIGLMHGKLKAQEKDEVMERFSRGELDVLVSTTVVEVGVDAPGAQIIIIENAEMFGLSQLHQLRGRVGRGSKQAYCFLMSNSESAKERLKIMCSTSDGFRIAEEDLRLRGPGDFLGDRQHGSPEFTVANLTSDMTVLSCAKDEAEALIRSDPKLRNSPLLLQKVQRILESKLATMN